MKKIKWIFIILSLIITVSDSRLIYAESKQRQVYLYDYDDGIPVVNLNELEDENDDNSDASSDYIDRDDDDDEYSYTETEEERQKREAEEQERERKYKEDEERRIKKQAEKFAKIDKMNIKNEKEYLQVMSYIAHNLEKGKSYKNLKLRVLDKKFNAYKHLNAVFLLNCYALYGYDYKTRTYTFSFNY